MLRVTVLTASYKVALFTGTKRLLSRVTSRIEKSVALRTVLTQPLAIFLSSLPVRAFLTKTVANAGQTVSPQTRPSKTDV